MNQFNQLLPNPGSHRAVMNGCKCNMLTNQFGRGSDLSGLTVHWEIDPSCTMHTDIADTLTAAQLKKEMQRNANQPDPR